MNLLDLPDEILIIIIKWLDISSLSMLYNVSDRVRNLINLYGIIKKCDLSLSISANVQILKSNFLKSVSPNLQELNVYALPNLNKSIFYPLLRRLKTLKTLNVACTKFTITDLIDIYRECPTIKNICINFSFDHEDIGIKMEQLQSVCSNLQNVHFVGDIALVFHRFAFDMLQKARLQSLQFSIDRYIDYPGYDNNIELIIPSFESFSVYFLHVFATVSNYGFLSLVPMLKMLNIQNYEIIIMIVPSICFAEVRFYSTPVFMDFFNEHMNVKPNLINNNDDLAIHLEGCSHVKYWNKGTTKFDSNFFSDLWHHFKQTVPYHFTSPNVPVLTKFDWYSTSPSIDKTDSQDVEDLTFKKKRIATPNHVLDYDTVFQDKRNIQFIILFKGDITKAVTLSSTSTYLKEITHFNLCGVKVRFSSEFFNILFRFCDKLVTLNVDALAVSSFCSALSRSLPLTRSVKNLRIVDRRIDFMTLFSSMSQCISLENVHVIDTAQDGFTISDPSLMFKNCVHLYSFNMYMSCTENFRKKQIQVLNKAIANYGENINVRFMDTYTYFDPYCEVFNIYRIKTMINV